MEQELCNSKAKLKDLQTTLNSTILLEKLECLKSKLRGSELRVQELTGDVDILQENIAQLKIVLKQNIDRIVYGEERAKSLLRLKTWRAQKKLNSAKSFVKEVVKVAEEKISEARSIQFVQPVSRN